MPLTERLNSLAERLVTYPLWEVVIELAIIWVVVYAIVRFVQGTRAAGALKIVIVLLLAATLAFRAIGGGEVLERLAYIYDRLVALIAIALVVIFQPELRRGLIRLGEARIIGVRDRDEAGAVNPIAKAARYLAKQRMGALIVIERDVGLRGLVEGGTDINATISSRLLQTIFFPGSALHDLAVVVRGTTLAAAGVQLPLAEPGDMPDPALGARHRAAVGLTRECDALAIVVSEETGTIRIAERGRLSRPYPAEDLADELRRRLGVPEDSEAPEPGSKEPETKGLSGEPLEEVVRTDGERQKRRPSRREAEAKT